MKNFSFDDMVIYRKLIQKKGVAGVSCGRMESVMKIWKSGAGVLAAVLLLTACGDQALSVDTNTLYIKKDGTVTEAAFELFDKEYYDAAELESFVKDEVKEYNYRVVREAVAVDKVEVADQVAAAYITYQSIEDYIAFNESDLFTGTVKEAMDAGYDFSSSFLQFKDEQAADLLTVTETGENQIIILNASTDVRIDGTICYISANVQKKDKKNVSLTQGELSYIIYK